MVPRNNREENPSFPSQEAPGRPRGAQEREAGAGGAGGRLAGGLPRRKAARSCPLGEPAREERGSYWVIRACQHLGYAARRDPIMRMGPVIALMKSTPV